MERKIDLPLLRSEMRKVRYPLFSNITILLIQHLLKDTISLIRSFLSLGANVITVGIPYWYDENIIKIMRKEGFELYTPKFPPDDCIETVLNQIVDKCRESRQKFLIVEDGGYAVPLLHTKLQRGLEYCIGAVEQTARGMWRDEDIKGGVSIPVLTIARSKVKDTIEPLFIGEAVTDNIKMLLKKQGDFIKGKKVIVVGYGTIGKKIAEEVKRNNAIVKVTETNPFNQAEAALSGFETDTLDFLIRDCNIIIGATGKPSISTALILKARGYLVAISASSRRDEIDMIGLGDLAEENKVSEIGTEYTLPNKNRVMVLAHGFPVNFFCSDSVPDKAIDPVLTELFLCVKKLATETLSKGIFKIGVTDDKGASLINEEELITTWQKIFFS
ncbi:MAG: NAD(P)-dependent oxidoreductase [Nitrospirota bacterium]